MSLLTFLNRTESITNYYKHGGPEKNLSTGWHNLDEYFLLRRGMLNVVGGIPSSGKSQWMDQLMLQTHALHDWHWTVYSPENLPLANHFQMLAEKWIGKPMFDTYAFDHILQQDVEDVIEELSQAIVFIDPPEDDMSIDPLIADLQESLGIYKTDAFLLDPWNEVEHKRPTNMTETEYIGLTLKKLRNFGRRHDVSMFVVAHPTKLQKDEDGNYPVPTPYDISGGANWRNKPDGILSLWRDYEEGNNIVEVHSQKVRNKNLGRTGMVELHWHRPSGLFFESEAQLRDGKNHGIRNLVTRRKDD